MSGFSTSWLTLREPADHRSVNALVRASCVRALRDKQPLRVVDLGCGTGSNLRGLSPALGSDQQWTLVDYDPGLLEAAREKLATFPPPLVSEGQGGGDVRTRATGVPSSPSPSPPERGELRARSIALRFEHAAIEVSFRIADLSRGEFETVTEGVDLVTASALFDLVSPELIERLAGQAVSSRQIFYTVLTYDGIAAWLPEHPADAAMRDAFNAHQRTDKGFGPAAGPEATSSLAKAFESRGYCVVRGKSPWVLDQSLTELRLEVDQGWANAVRETGLMPAATVDAWLAHRLSLPAAVTIVGHEDLLAIPPAS